VRTAAAKGPAARRGGDRGAHTSAVASGSWSVTTRRCDPSLRVLRVRGCRPWLHRR